jgi:hypothetical protein
MFRRSWSPYFQHILQGLRDKTPCYVHDVLADKSAPAWLVETGIAGIAIVDCRTALAGQKAG